MSAPSEFDAWSAGQSYEHYMGRWSRKIAERFVDWLAAGEGLDWLETGCGTGALTGTVLANCAPKSILATDRSADFVSHARDTIADPRVRFETADASALPADDSAADAAVSALVLNFIPDPAEALVEMQRALRPGGLIGFYVWDYPGGGIGFIDAFWKAAASLDPAAVELDESRRFPQCTKAGLLAICRAAGLTGPQIEPIEITAEFPDFEAFWHPFTLGAGPAPGYCVNLPEDARSQLKRLLADTLGDTGPIRLPARVWAVKVRKS